MIKTHKDNFNEFKCKNVKIESYVGDAYGVVITEKNKIWQKTSEYITKINKYYINNKLINNVGKTNVMIISNDEALKLQQIKMNDKIIKHSEVITILGMNFNDKLNWENTIATMITV